MFSFVVLPIWTAMHLYALWRISSIPVVVRRIPLWFLISVAGLLGLSYPLARFLERTGSGAVARSFEFLGATWIGILFLLFLCLLVTDLATGFGRFCPRIAPTLRGWAVLAAAGLSLFAMVQALRPPVVRNHQVLLAGLPAERDGTVIVVGSDFHLGTLLGERWLAARIAQIEGLRPDLVVLAGDIVEGDDSSERDLLPILGRLSAPLGVWAVLGNHEFHAGQQGGGLLQEAGFRVLRDRWAEVTPGLLIAGVDDLTTRRRHGDQGRFIERALASRPTGAATVLVSHTPWEADTAADAGAGLMLSGHTHNGQIWPFSLWVETRYPLMGGEYLVGRMPMLVCRGTGTWGPRMRLWSPGELLRITLRSPALMQTTRP